MKHIFVLSALIISSSLSAQVDYHQCQQALGYFGPQLDENGDFSKGPLLGLPVPDIETTKTDAGSRVTYTYKYPGGQFNGGKPSSTIYVIEKDKEGRVSKIISGGDKVDPQNVKFTKEMMLESAVQSSLPYGSVTLDPIIAIDMDAQGIVQSPISKLDEAHAKKFGLDMSALKKLRAEVKKDKKSIAKIRKEYAKFFEKAPIMMPMGNEYEVEIKDGACQVKSVTGRTFDPKTKEIRKIPGLTRERCQEVSKVYKKYEQQLNSCAVVNMKLSAELGNGLYGYPGGGYIGGSAGGMVGGVAGGYVGSVAGGMIGGAGGGYPGGLGLAAQNPYGSSGPEMNQCTLLFGDQGSGGWGTYLDFEAKPSKAGASKTKSE